MKLCFKCNKEKSLSEFGKDKYKKDGISSWCKECCNERNKKWKAANSEKVNKYKRKYYAANPDKEHKRIYEWYSINPGKIREYSLNWRTRKNNNGGKFTNKEWQELKKRYNYMCLRCKRYEPEIKLTVDHIKPLIFGGENTVKNIQPLCKSCNSIKGKNNIDYRLNIK